MLVQKELIHLGIRGSVVDLGLVETIEPMCELDLKKFKAALFRSGLEVLEDQKAVLIEKIKTTIIDMVHYEETLPKVKFSDFLSQKTGFEYHYLTTIFSEVKGITIEQYIINNKIERVKELLLYNELSLTEISYRMNYSSVAHLSNQFKKSTGLTPTFFKHLALNKKRIALNEL